MISAAYSAVVAANARYGINTAQASVIKLWSVLFAGAIAGDAIAVNASDIVLFDVATTVAYGSVTVYGEVRVSRALTTELKADKLLIPGGKWGCGEPTDLYPLLGITHTITLTGARSLEPAGNLTTGATATMSFNKAVTTSMGGELTLMAAIPAVTIVKLAATANIGDTSLTLSAPVTWKNGDQIHLTSTDYFVSWPLSNVGNVALDHQRGEYVTVTADVNGSTTVPCTALTYRHHGQLMYVVPPAYEQSGFAGTNLSYTQRTTLGTDSFGTVSGNAYLGQRILNAAAAGANQVIDNRCTVGHMTRSIRIEGATGTDWTTNGYGGTTMVMDVTSVQRLQGVAFNRVGKAGQLGQYPIHHHMRSYTPYGTVGSGTFLGVVNTNYNFTRGCVVRDSSNRGHTFHGTHAAELSNSIFVNTDTHCIFMEDNSEQLNIIDGNLVSKVNAIGYGKTPIKTHDNIQYAGAGAASQELDGGPAGIWYTNPNNYLRNNIVMGGFIGIWNAFSGKYVTCDKERGTRTGTGTIAFINTSIKYVLPVNTPETITMTATSATNFVRTGSVSGAMSAVTVGVQVAQGYWTYTITAGATPFAVNDTFIFDCVNRSGVFGASREVVMQPPAATAVLQHFNNECGCQGFKMSRTSGPVIDEQGNFVVGGPDSGKLGVGNGVDLNSQPYFDVIEKMNGWKSFNDWYSNQAIKPHYKGWTLCGVGGGNAAHGSDPRFTRAINGVVHIGKFSACTMAPRTLDNEGVVASNAVMTAYGGSAHITDSIMIMPPMGNLLGSPSQALLVTSGGFSHQSDYYNYAIQMVERNNTNIAFIGAQAGFPGLFDPPHWMYASEFGIPVATFDYSLQTIARAKGNAGARVLPADGSYFGMAGTWVFNHAFHTYGTTGGVTAQGYGDWASLNGVILPANTYEYYHVRVTNATWSGTAVGGVGGSDDLVYSNYAINYTHLQTDTVTPVTSGTWNTPSSAGSSNYPNMRSAAVRKGEAYDISWSRTDMPNRPQGLVMEVFGLWSTDSNVLFSVDWDGATAVSTCYTGGRTFTARTSKADILANRASNGYWVDTAANKLWVNVYGNAGVPFPSDPDVGLTQISGLGTATASLKVNR